MKLFEKISDLFKRKPKPTDIMLVLEYEYEEGLLRYVPGVGEPRKVDVTDIRLKPKRKKDKEKEVPYIVFPQNLPEPVEHSFVLRNISKLETAMNIKVHPLIFTIPKSRLGSGDGRIPPRYLKNNTEHQPSEITVQVATTFSDSVISHLGPGEFVRLNVECPAVGALDRGVLPRILSWVVNASSVNELFDDYTYFVNMSCESTDGRKFQIDQEIIFRPWKRKTCMGKIRRTEVTKNADL